MIAEIQANVRFIKSVKSDKGVLYILTCESESKQEGPYLFHVWTNKDGRKTGVQKLKVNIENQFENGAVARGFKVWEVSE